MDEDYMTHENEAVGQHAVDLCVGVLFSSEIGLGNGELFGGFLVRVNLWYTIGTTSDRADRMQMVSDLRTSHHLRCDATWAWS